MPAPEYFEGIAIVPLRMHALSLHKATCSTYSLQKNAMACSLCECLGLRLPGWT